MLETFKFSYAKLKSKGLYILRADLPCPNEVKHPLAKLK